MTLPQIAALAILGGMIVLFVWNRLRYDLVALLGLVLAVAVGIVPAERAFDGFRDQIVIIVASALILSAATGRSCSPRDSTEFRGRMDRRSWTSAPR